LKTQFLAYVEVATDEAGWFKFLILKFKHNPPPHLPPHPPPAPPTHPHPHPDRDRVHSDPTTYINS